MTPCALALDLSSTTLGWCQSHGGVWSWGEETFAGKTLDARLGAFVLWLKHRIPERTLVIERPFVKHKTAAEALYAVSGIARALAANAGCEIVLLSPSDIKRHWTGKAHATKEEMRVGGNLRQSRLVAAAVERGQVGEHALDSIAAMSCFEARDFTVKRKTKTKRKVVRK